MTTKQDGSLRAVHAPRPAYQTHRSGRRWGWISSLVAGLLLVLALGPGTVAASDAHAPGPDAASSPFLLTESFKNSTPDNAGWVISGTAYLTSGNGDPIGDGWLRLTPASPLQLGYAYYNVPFALKQGITVSFDYASWGGSGADGSSFFLFDGSTTNFSPGAGGAVWGGALGYTPFGCTVPGLSNGYVGIGLDEFGNFSSSTSGCNAGGPGPTPESVALRGSGSGTSGYTWLTGSGTLAQRLDTPNAPHRPSQSGPGYRHVVITIGGDLLVTVQVQFGAGSPLQTVINGYDLATAPGQVQLPATLKLGFAGAAGDATNNHEIRNLSVVRTWTPTGTLSTARDYFVASRLQNGSVLAAGGQGQAGYLASAELYNAQSGAWSPTGSLATARAHATATLLKNGTVLATGGFNGSYLASAEVYDPRTGAWTPTGSLATARSTHTATRLRNGQVLVAGGKNSAGALASAEIYNPRTGLWTATGSLNVSREIQAAALLPSGQVLVAGGFSGPTVQASAELYDPRTGRWTLTGSMGTPRYSIQAIVLGNGQVLVAGGGNNSTLALSSAELYNPATGQWTPTGSLNVARSNDQAVLLANGTVLIAGGLDAAGRALASAEVYDPRTGQWSLAGSMDQARYALGAARLASGQVLMAGGYDAGSYLASAELYTP